jgi:threonine dehydrogenase-like Zn-dependent dehydrogenase
MQAIRYAAKGDAGIADMPVPSLKPGHALIRVKASGLCQTDIEVLHGHYGDGRFPLVPGHEYAGIVEAVADDVTTFAPGARVAINPNLACGHCRACEKGLFNLCEDLGAYGVSVDGGFAAYSLVRVDHLHDIGTLSFETAALAEPLACVLNGLNNAGVTRPDGSAGNVPESAIVFGAGPIGLLLALSLKARGAAHVHVGDVVQSRLDFAERLGLIPAVSGSSELTAKQKHFDLVADATGIPAVVENMVSYTADGGTVMIFGVCAPDAKISIAPFEIFRRQIKIAGSHSLNNNIPQALSLLQADRDGVMSKLVSHRLPIAEILPFITKKSVDPATMKVQFVAD